MPRISFVQSLMLQRSCPAAAKEQGFALIGALWAILILAMIAGSVLTTSATETRLVRNRVETVEANALADAVINIAILRLLDTNSFVHPPVDANPFPVSFAGRTARVQIQDEAGKIDLNQAPAALLLRLLLSQGLELETARGLVDKILDWREPRIERRFNGAKAEDYRVAGFPYAPRNGPFETVEELKLVMGMSRELFESVAPLLTVYAQSSWPNPDVAPPGVLELVPDMDDAKIIQLLTSRAARDKGIEIGATGPVLGDAYTITVELPGRDSASIVRFAVIRLTGFLNNPFWIYRWN